MNTVVGLPVPAAVYSESTAGVSLNYPRKETFSCSKSYEAMVHIYIIGAIFPQIL